MQLKAKLNAKSANKANSAKKFAPFAIFAKFALRISDFATAMANLPWFFQGRLTRFEVYGAVGENLAKTAYFDYLHEVKEINS